MNTKLNALIITVLGVLLIAISAHMSITPEIGNLEIPITGQTLVVLLICFFTTRRLGLMITIGYLLVGILGLPVFADGASGIEVLLGNSGGFLVGFVVAGLWMSWAGSQAWRTTFLKACIAHLIGTIVILTIGFLRLGMLKDFGIAWQYGVLPYLPGGFIKILAGAIITVFIEYFIKRK